MISYRQGLPGWKDARHIFFRILVLCGDMAMVALGYSLAFLFRFENELFLNYFPILKGFPYFNEYIKASPVILFMWGSALTWGATYRRINFPALDEIIRLLRCGVMGTLLSMSAMFLYRESSFSRLVFLWGGIFTVFLLYAFRQLLKIIYVIWVRGNRRPRRVLVIGRGYLSHSLQKILDRQGDRAILQFKKVDIADIKKSILRSRINDVLLADPKFDHRATILLANYCEDHGVTFRLVPDVLEIRMGEVIIDQSLGIPTLQIKSISLHGWAFLTKRVMDVVLATLFIGIFFYPLALIAFLIQLTSPGPFFYFQSRLGYGSRSFNFIKFRTMVHNADDLLEDLKAKSDRPGPVFKMKNDPRITILGRTLRRYSLDELPQLLNVIKGEMSLVGPRPQVLWEAANYDEWAKKRLNVLPGITGLWQVSGRAELTFEEMIELDIFYIENWSPGLDIKIILKTLPAVLMGEGAY